MKKILKAATLLVLTLSLASVAVAQSTTETIVHRTGTVIAKYDGKIAVQMDNGKIREFPWASGRTVTIDGVPTTFDALKVGTVLSADFVKTETNVPVSTTVIKNARLIKVVGSTVLVQNTDGTYKRHTVPSGFKFLVEGKEVSVQDLTEGMNLHATIVSSKTETVAHSEIKRITGSAPAAPAPAAAAPAHAAAAPAPAPAVAPAAAPAAEPAPAPAKKLPKTGSPLPLAAVGGALSLLAGLGVRTFRRSN